MYTVPEKWRCILRQKLILYINLLGNENLFVFFFLFVCFLTPKRSISIFLVIIGVFFLKCLSFVLMVQRNGIKLLIPCAKSLQSCLTLCNPMNSSSPDSSVHGILQARNLDCHALLHRIFPTQRSNPGLLYCRHILYYLSHQRSPFRP